MKHILLLLPILLLAACTENSPELSHTAKVISVDCSTYKIYTLTLDGNDYYLIKGTGENAIGMCPKLPAKGEK